MSDARAPARRLPLEVAGYAVVAVVLGAVLWLNARNVDGFTLDEWFYTHGATYIAGHPGSLISGIPYWNRGPQLLYSLLLAVPYGLFGTSAAYTSAHLLNVGLVASGVVPLALLARRLIDSPGLRVLAVGLGMGLPWLLISEHLLTENLAYPLFLWVTYAIVRAAEEPSLRTQVAALAALVALALCRLNLGTMFAVLVLAVLAAELRDRSTQRAEPWQAWLRQALRRRALVVAAVAVALVGTVVLLAGASSAFGAYGGFSLSTITDALVGGGSGEMWRTFATYARGLTEGTFVLPVALGLSVGLAGAAGRLGRRLYVPALVVLGGLLAVLVTVSIWTKGAALEERYVFYPLAPLAVLAVAGVEQAGRLRRWLPAGGLLALFTIIFGSPWPGVLGEHFFGRPGQAFWSRVLDARLRQWEGRLLGWTSLPKTGWLLVAAGLLVLLAAFVIGRRRPRALTRVLTGALALVLVAQVLALNYDARRNLYGTAGYPGGFALHPGHSQDRDRFVDTHTPGDAGVAILAGLGGDGSPAGAAETTQFWNKRIDAVIRTRWNKSLAPGPPGMLRSPTTLDADGLATWSVPRHYLVATSDDPRVQFGGTLLAASHFSRYALYRVGPAKRAVWTATGLEGDGAVLQGRPVTLHLDRAARPDVHSVVLNVQGQGNATAPQPWAITRDGHAVSSGAVGPGALAQVRLAVPPCPATGACPVLAWQLRGTGPPVGGAYPGYGAPGRLRPVTLMLTAAHLGP